MENVFVFFLGLECAGRAQAKEAPFFRRTFLADSSHENALARRLNA